MLLEVEKLSIGFHTQRGHLQAVRDISFHVKPGETLGIVGESGCGKSITNMAIMGLLPPQATITASKLKFEQIDLLKLNNAAWRKIRGKDVAMIFQDPMSALNPALTVQYQIDETLKLHAPNLSKKDRYDRARQLMEQVGIPSPEERLKSFAHELSGGMAQRVMIAMALACDPKLLIADEPTTALDVTIQDQILRLLKDLQAKHHMAMILVTHDLGVVAQNADRIQVMYAGEVVETGTVSKIIDNCSHPYTQGLINSLPSKQTAGFRQPLPSIQGMVPDLLDRPMGCQFSPRCPYAQETCHLSLPPLEIKTVQGFEQALKCYYPLAPLEVTQ